MKNLLIKFAIGFGLGIVTKVASVAIARKG